MKTQETQEKLFFFFFFFYFSIKSLKGVRVQGRELLPEINFSSQRGMYMAGQAFVNQIFFFSSFCELPSFPLKHQTLVLF